MGSGRSRSVALGARRKGPASPLRGGDVSLVAAIAPRAAGASTDGR
jgi:hypothetical protein